PASTTALQPLARSIRCRCPRREKPVTSVAATTPLARAASLAAALRDVIDATAAARAASEAAPRLCAVATTPVPIALVRTSVSPGRAASVVNSRVGEAKPITAIPYLGSG